MLVTSKGAPMLKTIGLAVLALAVLGSRAESAIRCEGPLQVNRSGKIFTPYCQDNYLAQVARSYGMRVSNSAIRNNPGIKAEACRLVGADNRVRDICAGWRPEFRGFRY